MQGILMIRKVLEDNPRNTEAMFRLGFLAIQSGQMEKAVERFSDIIDIEPNDWNAVLYLGISYSELGQVAKAKKQFERIMDESDVPVLRQVAQSYLEQIK
ncbi:MAG: tetratricopeptide repeat protein, partial [Cyclobacteriaceae bacterium]